MDDSLWSQEFDKFDRCGNAVMAVSGNAQMFGAASEHDWTVSERLKRFDLLLTWIER